MSVALCQVLGVQLLMMILVHEASHVIGDMITFINCWWNVNCCCCLIAKPCLTLVTPWILAHEAPLSLGFSRQEYWSRLPFSFPGYLPDPGIKPRPPVLQALAKQILYC